MGGGIVSEGVRMALRVVKVMGTKEALRVAALDGQELVDHAQPHGDIGGVAKGRGKKNG